MDNATHALVLTGRLLPGHEADRVWPALASYFRMDATQVAEQLVPRAPVSIKESTDLAKLQGLHEGLQGLGADSQIHPLDDRGSVFAIIGGQPRGPMPLGLVEARVRAGAWPPSTEIAAVGSSSWQPYSRTQAAAEAAPSAPPPPAPPMHDDYEPAADMSRPTPAAAPQPVSARMEYGEMIPAGDAIHAGFWRRGAAMFLDGLILFIPLTVLGLIPILGILLNIVGAWLYFALMESSPKQATFGKQVFGLKVCDDYGHRIDFGRATGRYFGKILSSLILSIGYMMAGFTMRKQALHDSIAGCVVVFDTVDPNQPMPTVRPPMPWYGWALNIVMLTLPPLSIIYAVVALLSMGWH